MNDKLRILLLEDDAELREALEIVLNSSGFMVRTASDGYEAIKSAAEHPFDILVLDVKLPGPDGLEVLSQLKSSNPELLSIVITGFATEKDSLRALRLGVGDYIQKPFQSSVLLDAIRRLELEVHSRRKTQMAEERSRELLSLALEQAVSHCRPIRNQTGGSILDCARLAQSVARASGFVEEAAVTLRQAVLFGLLDKHDEKAALALAPYLPEAAKSLWEQMSEFEDRDPAELKISSLSELGCLCLKIDEDPKVLSLLESASKMSLAPSQEKVEKHRRRLFGLARTLGASGNTRAAVKAFQDLSAGEPSMESGRAKLELARLAWEAGKTTKAREFLKGSVKVLEHLGPIGSARLELEAGLAAAGLGFSEGKALLRRALNRLQTLGLESLYHQALVAVWALEVENEADFPRLNTNIRSFGLLLSNSRWLIPLLLKKLARKDEPILEFLVRDSSQTAGKILLTLSEPDSAERLLQIMQAVGGQPFEPALRQFMTTTKFTELKPLAGNLLSSLGGNESPTIRLYSLGSYECWIGEQSLSPACWRTARSRFLLPYLAQRNTSLLAETVTENLWPGVSPKAGKRKLTQTIFDFRKVLSQSDFPKAEEIILRKHDTLMVNPDLPLWHDLDEFQNCLTLGEREKSKANLRDAQRHYSQAFNYIRGRYLEDCPFEFVEETRLELGRLSVNCGETLATLNFELSHYPEAIEVASRVLSWDPCHQPMHIVVMKAQSEQGRADLALDQFEKAKQILHTEYQMEPSTEMLRTEQMVKLKF